MNYSEVESRLGYVFKDKNLLKQSLTLASFDPDFNNQTLEFFGDAILEFIVSERIFDADKSEGELTELRKQFVSDRALTVVAQKLGLKDFFIKAQGDNVLKKSIPSSYEAVLAAIYLDGGIEEAKNFVARTHDFTPVGSQKNYKGMLQEYLQSFGKPLPEYCRKETGTPQKPKFLAELKTEGLTFCAEADNVKSAEQLAAKKALLHFGQPI